MEEGARLALVPPGPLQAGVRVSSPVDTVPMPSTLEVCILASFCVSKCAGNLKLSSGIGSISHVC